MPGGAALGVGVSISITVLGAMLLAWLIVSERMAETAVGYGAMLILVLSSFLGSLIGCAVIKRRRLMVCGICMAGYYLGLIMIALLFGGEFQGMGVTALFVALGGGITAVLGLKGNRSGVRKHKVPSYR